VAGSDDATRAEWVARVLGVTLTPRGTEADFVPAPRALAERLTRSPALARPAGPPSARITESILAVAQDLAWSDRDGGLPQQLTRQAPRCLTSLIDEPAMSTELLAEGARLHPQDQMLTLFSQLDTVVDGMDRWDALLTSAETANAQLQQGGSEAEVEAYEQLRAEALSEQQRVHALLQALRQSCQGLTATAREAER
jgi:hypothetical protein